MKQRQFKIVEYLFDNQSWISGKELATRFEVTDRTIRSDIDKLNTICSGLIVSNNRLGYKLDINLYSQNIIKKIESHSTSPEERAISILKKLLYQNFAITMYDLEQEFYVSDYTIETDLRKIRSLIEPYEGVFLTKSYNRIAIKGDEISKRNLYKDLLLGEVHDNFVNIKHITKLYTRFDLQTILDKLSEYSLEEGYLLRTTALPMISIHIGITVDRMMHGNYLSEVKIDKKLRDSIEYKVAYKLCDYVCRIYQLKMVDSEIHSLTRLLSAYHDSSYVYNDLSLFDQTYNLKEVIDKIISLINQQFNVDFGHDSDFINGLQMHLSSMIERLENKQKISNLYLAEIKKDFPLVFEMGIKVSKLLQDMFKLEISEDEVGFISLHLGLAFERLSRNYKYRVVVIAAPTDRQISFLKTKLETKFSDRILIVNSGSVLDENKIKAIQPDIIISPLKLKHGLLIPTLQVSMFINQTDESLIFQMLNKLDKRRLSLQFIADIGEMIDSDFFNVGITYESREQAIKTMSGKLVENEFVDESYMESVFDRESMSCTAFDVGIAVPHPLQTSTSKSIISVSILEKPLDWGGIKVSMILLLSIDSSESNKMWTFFEWLGQIISDKTKLKELYESKSRDQFIENLLD